MATDRSVILTPLIAVFLLATSGCVCCRDVVERTFAHAIADAIVSAVVNFPFTPAQVAAVHHARLGTWPASEAELWRFAELLEPNAWETGEGSQLFANLVLDTSADQMTLRFDVPNWGDRDRDRGRERVSVVCDLVVVDGVYFAQWAPDERAPDIVVSAQLAETWPQLVVPPDTDAAAFPGRALAPIISIRMGGLESDELRPASAEQFE